MSHDLIRPGAGPGLIVVNPTVARLRDPGRYQRLVDEVQRSVLARTGQEPQLIADRDRTVMGERLAHALEDEPGLVVAVGGDGTLRDVVEAMGTRGGAPIAIVPVGTANLFAGALRIPRQPAWAARLIPHLVPRGVDLGTIRFGTGPDASRQRVFTVGAGIGFDARVMAAAGSDAKHRLGRYAYFAAAAVELARAKAVPLQVIADGTTLDVEAFEVLVANSGDLIPGLLRPALPVHPGDGLLDVFIVTGRRRSDAALGAMEALVRRGTGRSRTGRSYRLRVRSIRVVAGEGTPVEVDGDADGSTWFEARSMPRALTVLVPDAANRDRTRFGASRRPARR
jgi:diacylglycerol kinase (ATP)